MPAENGVDDSTRRRRVYLAASAMMLARAGEFPWTLIAVAGLLFFLAWVLSGMFAADLRLQRVAARLVRTYFRARRQGKRVNEFQEIVQEEWDYLAAVKAANKHLDTFHMDIIDGLKGRDKIATIRRLRGWLRWHPWHKIL